MFFALWGWVAVAIIGIVLIRRLKPKWDVWWDICGCSLGAFIGGIGSYLLIFPYDLRTMNPLTFFFAAVGVAIAEILIAFKHAV